jgi:FkbM family methyltransferase
VAFSDIVGATGKVFAFEPYPVNVKVLHDALSSSQYDNVEIIPYAVGHASSKVVFSPPSNTHSSGIGYVSLQLRTNEQKGLEVQCVTLDSMMDKLPPAKMIFIDVEGFEPFVLQGAHHYLQLGWPHLLMEAKPKWLVRAGTSLQDLYQELTLLGYQVFDTKGPHLTLIEADPKNDRGTDWLCIHRSQQSQQEIVYTAQKYLKKVFLLPFIFNVNPLSNFIRTKKTIFC